MGSKTKIYKHTHKHTHTPSLSACPGQSTPLSLTLLSSHPSPPFHPAVF
jgi:hypothetical protein